MLVETSLIAAAAPYRDEEERQIISRFQHRFFSPHFKKKKKIDGSLKTNEKIGWMIILMLFNKLEILMMWQMLGGISLKFQQQFWRQVVAQTKLKVNFFFVFSFFFLLFFFFFSIYLSTI